MGIQQRNYILSGQSRIGNIALLLIHIQLKRNICFSISHVRRCLGRLWTESLKRRLDFVNLKTLVKITRENGVIVLISCEGTRLKGSGDPLGR